MRTLVGDPGLAIGTRPARSARTGVRALASIEASGSVLAGPVVGTVVQVLIAKEPAPAFLAMASPGLVAGSMLATRIPDTVGAECSGPTIPALAFTGTVTVSVVIVTARQAHSFGAIVSFFVVGIFLPTWQANFVAITITSVMTKLVISGSAQRVTIFAIVVGRARHSVLVFQSCVSFLVNSVGPGASGIQRLLSFHTTNQSIAT